MLCYQSWHEMNQDLTPVMLPILTWEKTWVESSIKKSGDCIENRSFPVRMWKQGMDLLYITEEDEPPKTQT